jgi:hypothetical protein
MNVSVFAIVLAAIAAATSIAVLLTGPGEPPVIRIPDEIRLDIDQDTTMHKPPTESAPSPVPTATLYAPFE